MGWNRVGLLKGVVRPCGPLYATVALPSSPRARESATGRR